MQRKNEAEMPVVAGGGAAANAAAASGSALTLVAAVNTVLATALVTFVGALLPP